MSLSVGTGKAGRGQQYQGVIPDKARLARLIGDPSHSVCKLRYGFPIAEAISGMTLLRIASTRTSQHWVEDGHDRKGAISISARTSFLKDGPGAPLPIFAPALTVWLLG
jgi:hypothetical protein